MFERYTEPSRLAIFYALQNALAREAKEIETADLVIGIASCTLPEDHPLYGLKEHRAQLRESLFGNSLAIESPPKRDVPLTAAAKRALAYACDEAQRDNRYGIGPEHLLRGVILGHDHTKPVLSQAGYTLASLRLAAKQSYAKDPGRPAPIDVARQRRLDKKLITILLILLGYIILYACQ